ncbi:MAG: hypothetical protein IJ424_07285 [Oscillospiraceae bacterium]|nr:hypothetical protein [Oscillospiraceae bacterium]
MTFLESIKKSFLILLCGVVFIVAVLSGSVLVHADSTVTVIYTKEDLIQLMESAEFYYIYQGTEFPMTSAEFGIFENFDYSDGYPLYSFNPQVDHGELINVAVEFKFPFDVQALSSDVTILTGISYSPGSMNIAWENSLNSLSVWNYVNTSTYYFTSGFSCNATSFTWTGDYDANKLYCSVNDYVINPNQGVYFGLLSLSCTYTQDSFDEIVNAIEKQNIILEGITNAIEKQASQDKEYQDSITKSTEEDNSKLDELEQDMQDVQNKADEYNEVMDSVETPEAEEVIPEDSVSDILDNEDVSEGQPYIFSILESLQSITWILTMILISVTVGIIKYIIYGKS